MAKLTTPSVLLNVNKQIWLTYIQTIHLLSLDKRDDGAYVYVGSWHKSGVVDIFHFLAKYILNSILIYVWQHDVQRCHCNSRLSQFDAVSTGENLFIYVFRYVLVWISHLQICNQNSWANYKKEIFIKLRNYLFLFRHRWQPLSKLSLVFNMTFIK